MIKKMHNNNIQYKNILPTFAHLYINLACLSVCLYPNPIKVKAAEPIGPKFCVGPHVTPGKVYE